MLRPEIAAAVLRGEVVRNDSEHPDGLGKTNRGSLSISLAQVELSKNVVQTPLLLGRSRLPSSTQSCHQGVPVLPIIQAVCQEDLSQHDAASHLYGQGSRSDSISDDSRHPLQGARGILTSGNRLQFDLDEG